MALTQDELFKLDLYEILGLDVKCTLQEIKKAFRKKALKCHPDKNPDDPNAAQLFHQLSCALEILADESARAAYDKVLNARKAVKIRNQQLDSRRKKLKEDLEERERNAGIQSHSNFKSEESKLKAEIERLRKEGSRLLQEEISRVQEEVNSNRSKLIKEDIEDDFSTTCFSIRWKVEKHDEDNAGYTYNNLLSWLSKYGEVSTLILSGKRKGRAIVEFKTYDPSILESDIGLPNNPLTIEIVKGPEPPAKTKPSRPTERLGNSGSNVFPSFSSNYPSRADDAMSFTGSMGKNPHRQMDEDLENTVLQRLRQMERMKRAAEEK